MKRWGNITFLSLTTIAAFFLLIQTLTFLNWQISEEIDHYWMSESRIGMVISTAAPEQFPAKTMRVLFHGQLKAKGPLTHLLELVEEHGPGEPTPSRPIFWGIKNSVPLPGRTEAYNGWVDALSEAWKRTYADTPDAEKNAFQARLGQVFAAAGIEGGKFGLLKIAAGDKLPDVRRKVETFRVLAMGLNQGGQ